MPESRFIVTGSPRSATGYASLLFEALGIRCGHEVAFRPRSALVDILEWLRSPRSGESSWLGWLFLPLLPEPVKVLHALRDPWRIVESLAWRNDILHPEAGSDKESYREIVRRWCPEVYGCKSRPDRAAQFLVSWSARVEEAAARSGFACRRYRVEELNHAELYALTSWLGLPRDRIECQRALAEVPRNVNAGKLLEFDVPVTNPALRQVIDKIMPGAEYVISKCISRDERRTREQIAEQVSPELRVGVEALAEEWGYAKLETAGAVTAPALLEGV